MNNNIYRYQLERYRGRSTRYNCPQCGRKQVFTRYIDTYNNIYINDKVGKCNRIDKCGYHYTPKQYFEDNPWLKEDKFSFFQKHRKNEKMKMKTPPPPPIGYISEAVYELFTKCDRLSDHARWLVDKFGIEQTQYAKSKEYVWR